MAHLKKILTQSIPLITFFFLLTKIPVWCAGPMMDGSTLDVSQSGAVNAIRDGNFSGSVKGEQQALKIDEELKGPLHPSLVPIYNNLGTLYRYMADYEQAEQNYNWGLALLEKNFGPKDPRVAASLENLAGLYNDLNRLPEAELDAKRALSLRETDPNSDPQTLAQTQCLLAQIEMNLHNHSQAQKLFESALKNIEKGSSNPSLTIALYNNLARICQIEKNMTQAHTYLERSLDIAKKNFHPDDIEISDAMTRLADFFHDQGLEQKARPFYESAYKIDQRYVGSVFDYGSLPYLKRMANAYLTAGDAKASEALWEKSIQTEKQAYNPRHPKVALDLIQLAHVESVLGKKESAEKSLRESLGILKSYFDDDHPLVIQVQTLLKKIEK